MGNLEKDQEASVISITKRNREMPCRVQAFLDIVLGYSENNSRRQQYICFDEWIHPQQSCIHYVGEKTSYSHSASSKLLIICFRLTHMASIIPLVD